MLTLKAQFLSRLTDIHLLLDIVEYVNLSFNNFEVNIIFICDSKLAGL